MKTVLGKTASINRGDVITYFLYDIENNSIVAQSAIEVLENLDQVNGFKHTDKDRPLRLHRYYLNIPVIGDETANDDKKHYTCILRIFKPHVLEFKLVDKYANCLTVNRQELLDMISSGVLIAGVELSVDVLRVASDIAGVYINRTPSEQLQYLEAVVVEAQSELDKFRRNSR